MSARMLGCIPSVLTPREQDFVYRPKTARLRAQPLNYTLRPSFTPFPPYDQGALRSCVANALAAPVQLKRFRQGAKGAKQFMPSRLFIYYNGRVREYNVMADAGMQIVTGIRTLVDEGACSEKTWAYNLARFRTYPSQAAWREGKKCQLLKYERVLQDAAQMKGCLLAGNPVVTGFVVYDSFMTAAVARTGKAPLPLAGERALGGHAVVLVGYDDGQGLWLLRNSWNVAWGDKGYFTLPYEYLLSPKFAFDFWSIDAVE